MMSRSELISFLSEEKGPLSRTNKSTEEYRDRVGAIMLDKLLKELNSDSLLTEVMDKPPHSFQKEGGWKEADGEETAGCAPGVAIGYCAKDR